MTAISTKWSLLTSLWLDTNPIPTEIYLKWSYRKYDDPDSTRKHDKIQVAIQGGQKWSTSIVQTAFSDQFKEHFDFDDDSKVDLEIEKNIWNNRFLVARVDGVINITDVNHCYYSTFNPIIVRFKPDMYVHFCDLSWVNPSII